jgi:prepilin-type N-terminal cleavage/methylation domain-containing protein
MGRIQISRRGVYSEEGFTLVEVLVAIALITIALLGLTATVGSGLVSGMSWGQAGVTRAYYVSTATVLAQERLEQLKRLTYDDSTDQLSSSPPSGFSDENYGSISGYSNFKREVRVTSNSPATNIKTISVKVYYRLPTATGLNEESVVVYTLRAKRPD